MCFHVQQIPQQKIKPGKHEVLLKNEIIALAKNYYTVSGFTFPNLIVIPNLPAFEPTFMQWGLIPFWVKTTQQAKDIRLNTLNAKCETLFEKPAFRNAAYKRCILPVNGFFEWHTKGKNKYPFYIKPSKHDYFFLACIFDEWTNIDTGENLQTFSIVTTAANKTMAYIHNSKQRMPLILDNDGIDIWLDPNVSKKELIDIFKPFDDDGMQYYSIGKLITSRKQNPNVPEVTMPYKYNELI